MNHSHEKTRRMVGLALFTALVVILKLLGSFIRFGPFSISLVTLPIVVGAVLYGAWGGVWLGLVFGVTVLLSGDAATYDAFRALDPELKAMPEADYDWYEKNYVNCYYPVRFMLRFHGAMPAGEEGEPV